MHFPTTHWSLLAKATLDGEPESRAALEELCGRYWRPLKEFIQARGHNPTEVEDVTQAFLVHLLEHSTFRRADAARGRFRSFLLGALARYLGDQRDKRGAQKRGGQVAHTSLDDENTLEPAAVIRAEETFHFDRAWAVAVLRASLARARAEYASSGREEVFVTLRSFMPGAGQAPSYEQAAAQCGLSVAAFTSELHRLRRRVREFARDEVMQTVAAPHEVDGELDHLRRVLMDRGTQFPTGDES